MRLTGFFAAAALAASLLAGCGDAGNSSTTTAGGASSGESTGGPAAGGGKPAKPEIAVIPKGTTHSFWKSVHAGALKAEDEKKHVFNVLWQGPEREDNRDAQIKMLQTMVAKKVAAIVIAPLDETALAEPINQAVAAGIPVVVFDSAVKTDKYVSFIATDNRKGGQLAGEQMGKILNGKGRLLVMRYMTGSASTHEREEGFIEAAKKAGLEIADDKQEAGATVADAITKAEQLIASHRKGEALDVDGIFTPNESSTAGMLEAVRKAGLAGKVKFIGFDASDPLVRALREGTLDGLVLQDPMGMGYQGVLTAYRAVKEEKNIPKDQPITPVLATKDNMNDPEIKNRLEPDFRTYLKE